MMTNGDLYGTEVYFEPWTTDDNFDISVLKLHSSLGGKIASGTVRLIIHWTDEETEKKIKSLNTGKFKIKTENSVIEIPVFILSKSYLPGQLELGFVCTEKQSDDFLVKHLSMTYKGVEEAVGYYFPKYDANTKPVSDLTSLAVNQVNEIGRDFCNRIAIGWKPETVFGYNLEGNLVIRDISTAVIQKQDKRKLAIGKTILISKFPMETWKPILRDMPVDPWDKASKEQKDNLTKRDYSGVAPKEITSRIFKGNYSIYSKSFISLHEASTQNSRYYAEGFKCTGEIKSTVFPEYRLGDVIELAYTGGEVTKADKDSEPLPEPISKNYVIGSFDIFWTGKGNEGKTDEKNFAFSVTSTIYGLDTENKPKEEKK